MTKAVEYEDGDVLLEGWLAYDGSSAAKRPGVLVVHEWWGLDTHPKQRAESLAKMGYVAFALDMYGKGRVTTDAKQAGEWAGAFRGEKRDAGRRRARAGLDVLLADPRVDARHVAAIGFCFGGTIALELAWSGAPLDAAVCFHGSPTSPDEAEAKRVTASVLVCHGGDDTFVPKEMREAFEDSMRKAGLDWQFVAYGGAVHSFTNPAADHAGIPGVATTLGPPRAPGTT